MSSVFINCDAFNIGVSFKWHSEESMQQNRYKCNEMSPAIRNFLHVTIDRYQAGASHLRALTQSNP